MYFVYSLLLTLGFVLLLPRFLFDAFRHGKYVAGFGERWGLLQPLERAGRPVVWLHCVSVGETQAARPLVKEIRKRFPSHLLVISTITLTGQQLAKDLFADDAARIIYFPFDWRLTVRRALKAIEPSAVLLMETEIWPNFLRECQARDIPVAIVNGRISNQSFRRYALLRSFLSRVLNCLTLAAMQTNGDAQRIRTLGLEQSKVFVTGNLKFDAGTISVSGTVAADFRERFNISNHAPLVLAASTHAPEESILLEAVKKLATGPVSGLRLILAPRHPERFAEVATLLERSGLAWTKRTNAAALIDENCNVILLDTIGELVSLYSLASVVFVGGSIANHGGHNVVEPAAAGVAIVTGSHTHNFDAIVEEFVAHGALIQLQSASPEVLEENLTGLFKELLLNQQYRDQVGQKARSLVGQNLGATDRTLKLLDSILSNHK